MSRAFDVPEVGGGRFPKRFVGVAHHAHRVGHPQRHEVQGAIPPHPLGQVHVVVVAELVHVVHHPAGALAVLVVPGAVAAALLGPQIDHLAHVV